MRIAHVFPSRSWGGAEIYAVQLAEAQQKQGLNVALWVPQGSRLEQAARRFSIPVITDEVPWRWAPFQLPRLASVLKRSQIDLLHFHWSGGVWAFWGARWFHPVRRIYHIHLWMKHSKKDPLHWFLYRSVDLILVAGQRAMDRVKKLLPVRLKTVQILPYAIDFPEGFQSESEKEILKNELGLQTEGLTFGLFARLDRQKGHLEFLTAFERLLQNVPQTRAQIILIGDPTHGELDSERYANEVFEKLKSPLLKGRVSYLPSQKDFRKYLELCDVLALPSYHESYSLMILHAFACQIPVMASHSGGTPDLVNNERGWLFAPEDVYSLYSVLSQITPEQVQARKGTLKSYVHGAHSFEAVTRELSQMIGKLPSN